MIELRVGGAVGARGRATEERGGERARRRASSSPAFCFFARYGVWLVLKFGESVLCFDFSFQ